MDILEEDARWHAIQHLVNIDCKILWVTSGLNSRCGLARVARAENPGLIFLTLDVESGSTGASLTAIDRFLETTWLAEPSMSADNEYAERNGIVYISIVQPDERLNKSEKPESKGEELQLTSLRDAETGTMDSLHYSEVSKIELPIPDGLVEVKIYAAGLNVKVSGLSPLHS